MIKVVSVIMAAILCLCILPTAGISAEEGVYYAHIAGFTAVYDQNTQKVEFCVEFDGSVLESEEFVVRIHCSVLEPITNKWVSDQTINAHQLSYGACLREGNRLVGAIPLDGSKFNSEYYKDFRISVSGKTVESGGNLYYTLDSKDIPLSPKAAYNGEAVTVVPKLLPANTAVGGYVMLKLSVTDKLIVKGLTIFISCAFLLLTFLSSPRLTRPRLPAYDDIHIKLLSYRRLVVR